MGISVQAPVSDCKKVLSVAEPAQRYLSLGLALRAQFECAEVGPDHPMRVFHAECPDIVVVDCGDPEDGCLAAISEIRLAGDVPIIALVPEGRSGVDALVMGADGVCFTPIHWEEFEARIDRLLQGNGPQGDAGVLKAGPVRIDFRDRSATCRGQAISLTATEFRMLVAFVRRPDEVLGHPEIVDLVWHDAYRAGEEVKLYVSYLRKKFRPTGVDPIETLRGVGYSFRPRPLD